MPRLILWHAVLLPLYLLSFSNIVPCAEETNCEKRSDANSNFCDQELPENENYDIEVENLFQPWRMRQITINFDHNISLNVLEGTTSVCSTGADDTGLVIWGPSLALSQYLITHRDALISGKRVLELGSGVALPSMLSYRLGATGVTATDFRPQTLKHIQFHAQLNKCSVHVELLDWTKPDSLGGLHPDIVLAADVIYGLALVQPLVETVERILPKGSTLIIATRDGRIGIPEFRQMMNVNFVEVQVEKSKDHMSLPPIPQTIRFDPLIHDRWSGQHSIFTYRWRDED